MERHLTAALAAEDRWRDGNRGAEHPVFKDPVTGLGVFGLLLQQTQEAKKGDRGSVAELDAVEQDLVDRVCAVAQVCETPELRQLATELVPRQARRRGDSQPLTLFDVARAFSRRVPLPKLVSLESAIRPYLSCVLVDAMAQ
jgi:hypothetical protein